MTSKPTLRLARLAACLTLGLALAACQPEPAAEAEPAPEAAAPAAVVAAPVFEPRTVVENAYPVEDRMRGNSVYVGAETRAAERAPAARIADRAPDTFSYFEAVREDLVPGTYRATLDLRLMAGATGDVMIRLDPADTLGLERADVMIAPDGTVTRARGGARDVVIGVPDTDGFRTVSVVLPVSAAGEYRVLVYPAAGAGGAFDKLQQGEVGLGGVTLTQIAAP